MTVHGSLPAEGGETLPLSAIWFRRERERLAISRRVLAQRLQVPQGRIATLETEQRSVPASWIKLLSELEFRIPLGYASSAEPEVPAQPEQPAAEQTGSRAEDTQAGAQAIPPARKQRFRRVDGRWLRAERERLGGAEGEQRDDGGEQLHEESSTTRGADDATASSAAGLTKCLGPSSPSTKLRRERTWSNDEGWTTPARR